LSFIDNPRLKRGEITITARAVYIPFSTEVTEIKPKGQIGVDLNEKNVTVAATNGYVKKFNELAEVSEIKERYRGIRAKIGKITRQDRRVGRRLYKKYGERERNRTSQRLNKVSKEVVSYAKSNSFAVVMEKLTGIRKLYRKGNGQGKSFRGRMNSWTFHEIQRQTDYKAKWEGIPVHYVNPKGTSSNCPVCGSSVARIQDRKVYCPECDMTWDRDVLASKNIMACAVPQARPPKRSDEGERDGEGSNPPSRWAEVDLGRNRVPKS